MTTNLIPNRGFEGITRPGGYTNKTHTGEVHGNFVSPEGWIGWWDEREGRRRPETKVIQNVPPFVGPPARVFQGDWAALMFVSFQRWTGGWYTVVDVEPGRTYRTGYMAHAWANNDNLPNNNNPGCSGVGCGAYWCLEEFLPPLNSDPVNDAAWAVLFQVGVQELPDGAKPDPTFNVRWGAKAAIYNVYGSVPTLEFTAGARRVAIFTRAEARYPFRNNDAYIDAPFLFEVAEPSPSEPCVECDGAAREAYDRTYVLLPPTATGTEMRYLIDKYWDKRYTFGFSADDAGIGCGLKSRRVIAVRPEAWTNDLEEFFNTYYPGVIYEVEPPQVLLGQRDPDWANARFGER